MHKGGLKQHHFIPHIFSSVSKDEGDTSLGRLPTDLYPINYQLELQPDIYTGAPPFFFNGSVTIRVECEVPTNIVYLNSDGINIDHSSIDITVASDSPVSAPQPVYVRHDLDETLLFLKVSSMNVFLSPDICIWYF